jgi:hypothetical protein
VSVQKAKTTLLHGSPGLPPTSATHVLMASGYRLPSQEGWPWRGSSRAAHAPSARPAPEETGLRTQRAGRWHSSPSVQEETTGKGREGTGLSFLIVSSCTLIDGEVSCDNS